MIVLAILIPTIGYMSIPYQSEYKLAKQRIENSTYIHEKLGEIQEVNYDYSIFQGHSFGRDRAIFSVNVIGDKRTGVMNFELEKKKRNWVFSKAELYIEDELIRDLSHEFNNYSR